MRKFLIHLALVSIVLLFSAQSVASSYLPIPPPFDYIDLFVLFSVLFQVFSPFAVLFIGLFLLYKNLKSQPINKKLSLLLPLVLAAIGLVGSIFIILRVSINIWD